MQFDREYIGKLFHESWSRTKRAQGFHGPDEACGQSLSYRVEYNNWETRSHTAKCGYKESELHDRKIENPVCIKLHSNLVPWLDLPETRRQEYLATAKAVLPEIVGEVLKEAVRACERVSSDPPAGDATEADGFMGGCHECEDEILKLRDRRLKELK